MSTIELQQAVNLIRSGKTNSGKQILTTILNENPQNEQAWLWLAVCETAVDQKLYCLRKTLSINPQNETAKRAIEKLEAQEDKPVISEIVGDTASQEKSTTQSNQERMKIKNKLALAANAQGANSYKEARDIYVSVLETDLECGEAWLGKGLCEGMDAKSFDDFSAAYQEIQKGINILQTSSAQINKQMIADQILKIADLAKDTGEFIKEEKSNQWDRVSSQGVGMPAGRQKDKFFSEVEDFRKTYYREYSMFLRAYVQGCLLAFDIYPTLNTGMFAYMHIGIILTTDNIWGGEDIVSGQKAFWQNELSKINFYQRIKNIYPNWKPAEWEIQETRAGSRNVAEQESANSEAQDNKKSKSFLSNLLSFFK